MVSLIKNYHKRTITCKWPYLLLILTSFCVCLLSLPHSLSFRSMPCIGSSVFFWLNSTQKVFVCETHAIYMTSRAKKTIVVGFQTIRNNWKNNKNVVVFIRWWNLFKKDLVFCFGIREISYFQHIVPCTMEKRDYTFLPLKDVHIGILKIGKGWKYG